MGGGTAGSSFGGIASGAGTPGPGSRCGRSEEAEPCAGEPLSTSGKGGAIGGCFSLGSASPCGGTAGSSDDSGSQFASSASGEWARPGEDCLSGQAPDTLSAGGFTWGNGAGVTTTGSDKACVWVAPIRWLRIRQPTPKRNAAIALRQTAVKSQRVRLVRCLRVVGSIGFWRRDGRKLDAAGNRFWIDAAGCQREVPSRQTISVGRSSPFIANCLKAAALNGPIFCWFRA